MNYIIESNLLNLYKHSLFFLFFLMFLKEDILKIPGTKLYANGYIMESVKLKAVFSINANCVFLYTAQKPEIKYQKKKLKIKLITKKNINLIFNSFKTLLLFSFASLRFVSFLIDKIDDWDKDNTLNILFIGIDIKDEINIWGVW